MLYKNDFDITKYLREGHRSITDVILPPILDSDPSQAAKDLTIKDCSYWYKQLKEFYIGLENNTGNYFALSKSALFSKENFLWFSTFFKTLEELEGVSEKYEIPYQYTPENSTKKTSFYPPVSRYNAKDGVRISLIKIKLKDNNFINMHRVAYIGKDYVFEDFRDGFPNWYLMKQTTVFEAYNHRTNVRVRIDHMNGEFYYFISGASDNWSQIVEVPYEIDSVVSALLYRGYEHISTSD